MNLQWVSSDVIVAELEATYNINSNNYIHKLSFWITQALANYAIYIPLEPAYTDLPIEEGGVITMPDDVKGIVGISYNGEYVPQGKCYRGFKSIALSSYNDMIEATGFVVKTVKDEDGNIISKYTTYSPRTLVSQANRDSFKYYVNNSRVITVTFGATGDLVRLYYIRLPHDYDHFTGSYLVKVPDNEIVQQNITWFILRNLLYSGYSHHTLNLGAAAPYLNPAKMYEMTFAKARSQFLKSDRSDYGKYRNLMTTILHAYQDPSANLQQH